MDIHKVVTTEIALDHDDLLLLVAKKFKCSVTDVTIFASQDKLDGVLIKKQVKIPKKLKANHD